MSTIGKINEVLHQAKEPLTRSEIFELAGVAETMMSLNVFELLHENGKLERTGKGRGTKYKLVVTKPIKPKKESPDYTQEVMVFANSNTVFTFRELAESFSENTLEHHVRFSLNQLIEEGKIHVLGEKRDRRYSTNLAVADVLEAANESEKYEKVVVTIWPYFEEKRKGVLMNDLCEKYKDIPKHIMYQTIRYLLDMGKIEKFGERRGTTYSVDGEGELDKDLVVEEAATAIQEQIMDLMKVLKAARPLYLQQKLQIDRIILNCALDALVSERRLKEDGERRGKLIALPGASEQEMENARENQQCTALAIDKFSGMLTHRTVALAQRFGTSPYELRAYESGTLNKEVLSVFHTYERIQQWFMEVLKSDVHEIDRANSEVTSNSRRTGRKSA